MRASELRRGGIALVAAGLIALLGPLPARADDAGDARLRDQLRQTVMQLRQAEDDNADLKAKLDAATQQAATQTAEAVAAAKKQSAADPGLRRALEEQKAKTDNLQQQYDTLQKSLDQWKQAYQQAVLLARSRDGDAHRLDDNLKQTSAGLQACEDRNAKLVQLGDELLAKYKDKGVWESLHDAEPFTQLHHVELEKLAQDYHDRIVDATVAPAGGVRQ